MRKSRFRILCAVLLGLAASLTAFAQTAAKKPNILIIWGDDIGYWNLSAYNQGMMRYTRPTSIASRRRARSSPTGTASRAAPPAARRSSPDRSGSGRACSRSACRARRKACRRAT